LRKSLIVVLGLVMLFASTALLPAYAAKKTYKAGGIVTNYGNAWTSEIVSGHWSVTVVGNEITDFKLFYIEENLPDGESVENSPAGSRDNFWYTLTSADNVKIDKGVLTFDCIMHIDKLWTKMDGTKEWYRWESAVFHIRVDSDEFVLDRPPFEGSPEQDFDVYGVTNHLK